jgi:dolichol-phosphate mannosyltransferase
MDIIQKLSIVIPCHNEDENLENTLSNLYKSLTVDNIPHEILTVDDHSNDGTKNKIVQIQARIPTLVYLSNPKEGGFGMAVRHGLENFTGDCVAIMMADASDDPQDLIRFYKLMWKQDYDCVFGSRFIKGGSVHDYPKLKLVINRLANGIVRLALNNGYNDFTNAFKLYKKETILGLKPFLSPHFNLTLELPLKAVVRGYSYAIVPNSWTNRTHGTSNLKIKEMGSRYFFILLYCLIEKYFSKGDYNKKY